MPLSETFDAVPVIQKLRERILKWWGLEIGVVGPRGRVLGHARGVVRPSKNAFCETSLLGEGIKMCNRSIGQAAQEAAEAHSAGARLVRPCHLGFPIAMAPIVAQGTYRGAVFCGGFLVRGYDQDTALSVESNAVRLRLPIGNVPAALRDIPRLTERDLEYLGDLLETLADELASRVDTRRDPRQFGDLIGRSPMMQRLYNMLDKLATSDATVLIIGENGTGKEVLARAVHSMGLRSDRRFVATNCAALSDNLLDSELFGHVKGSFTGAMRDKDGLFRVADGGTLFLDEVGDTSSAMQVKLLRVLQEGTFMPVGATDPVSVDVRVVAATNRPLHRMVERGAFRQDLYYRLNVIGLELPPLRDRKMDLPLLYDFFLDQHHQKSGGPRKTLSPRVIKAFWEYDWPGNVRQLSNEIERLVVLSGDAVEIGPDVLSPPIRAHADGEVRREPTAPTGVSYREAVADFERRLLRGGLVRTGWNKSQLARDLGISRTTLIKKVRELGLEEPSRRDT